MWCFRRLVTSLTLQRELLAIDFHYEFIATNCLHDWYQTVSMFILSLCSPLANLQP